MVCAVSALVLWGVGFPWGRFLTANWCYEPAERVVVSLKRLVSTSGIDSPIRYSLLFGVPPLVRIRGLCVM